MHHFLPKTIKAQLASVAVLILFSVVVFAATFHTSFSQLNKLDTASMDILKSQTSVLMLRRHEKDFMARNDTKYKGKFEQEFSALTNRLSSASAILNSLQMEKKSDVQAMLDKLNKYKYDFDALIEQRLTVGVSHDKGLQGAARDASHRIEKEIQRIEDDGIYKQLLMLRRHEKDFLLRSDEKYINAFNAQLAGVESSIASSDMPASNRLIMESALKDYQLAFNALAQGLSDIGLTPQDGLHGSLRASVRETEAQMKTLSQDLVASIKARESSVTTQLILVGAILATILCFTILLISHHVTKKVSTANQLMHKIASGNTSLDVRMNLPGNDELSQLALHFNTFISNLQSTMEKIGSISSELTSNAHHSYSLAQKTAENAEKQRAESESVATAMNEMTATSKDIAQSVAQAASVANELQQSAQTGRNVNTETSTQANELSESMQSASQNMQQLNSDSEEIGSVIDVIRSITEQTNLLALNAAIEAARAGDQGRGFAVVADQVRELAMKTHQSTDEITNIIEQLQQGIKRSVEVMTQSSEMASRSVNQALEGASVIVRMVDQIENIAGQNMQIATASEEQTVVTESVDRNIIVIADLAGETADAARNSHQSANTIEALSKELDALVKTFAGNNTSSKAGASGLSNFAAQQATPQAL
ncbi:methyl-accepting chemotaxis protein [Enterovibrio sp. ZSDZ35]|uniref:Methyl-accepting chemotaxis protein n=1 Tax=Enterovibrio qingdaonensis TaxID=2899818 RepID=A0ABT5QGS6_9GAMM|nr:HAMP domain-containing methyl-accepting chemotaxis protein [Enterovibrio sp. ZSDZ35]MDD1780064.1 methyl-accepting chemotaxis protein [Enterovibrio sp. ZSDZ35]